MKNRDVVVVGASAGGVEALRELVAGFPASFPAAILVVLHMSENAPSVLPEILSRASRLPAEHPRHGERIRPGRIYVAPPGHHMVLDETRIRLSKGPKEHHTRPAIDPLFRSAALHFGPRAIGVVLTGFLDDGTAGLVAIKARGGLSIVQDPAEARHSSMPLNALRHDSPDYCLPLAQIAARLVDLTSLAREPVQPAPIPASDPLIIEVEAAARDEARYMEPEMFKLGTPSVYSCPDCHGVLFEIGQGQELRFRCRTGHAFTALTLLSQQASDMEAQVWSTIRAMEEHASLALRIAEW